MPKDNLQDKKSTSAKERKEEQYQSSVQFQFDDEEKKKIADMVSIDFQNDRDSRSEYTKRLEEVLFLFEGKRQPKNDPWPNCSNVNTMITAVAVEIVHSKLLPAIANENNFDWRCEDLAFSDNQYSVRKFMRWAMRDANFGELLDDLSYDSVLIGTTAHKIRKEINYKWVQRKIKKPETIVEKAARIMGVPTRPEYTVKYEYIQDIRRVIDSINIEDIYWPYHAKHEQDCDHIIHRFYKLYPEALDLERRGYWVDIEEKLQPTADEIVLEGKTKEDMEAEGIAKVESLRDVKPLMFVEWYGKYDHNHDGKLEECVFTVHLNDTPYGGNATYVSGKPLTAVSRIEQRPFVVGQYIRRSNRLLGKGIGHLMSNIHEHIDTIYNQKTDAGTISLIPFGVYTPASGFDPDEVELSPGSWFPVDDVNGIKFVQVPNNTLASWQDIQFLIGLGERLTSTPAYMQGRESEVAKSGATATGTLALIQEGQQMFVKTARRIARTAARVAEALLQSYQEDMPPGLAERITGEGGEQLFPEGLSPEDIAGKYTCYLNIDTLEFNKSTRRSIDIQIYQFFLANPIVMSNPTYIWELSSMVLRSVEKSDNEIERIIGPRPDLTFSELDDAKQENYQMMAGRRVEVDQNEPLFEHLVTHLAFRSSPVFKELEPEKQVLVDDHIADTKLALTMKLRLMQAQQQQMAQQPMGGVGGQAPGQVQPGSSAGNVPIPATVRPMASVPPAGTEGGIPRTNAAGQGAPQQQLGGGTVLPR